MKKKIAIIGANSQQNPLILKAKEKGYETHVFAWQTGNEIGEVTSDFFYPISAGRGEEILERCREIGISSIVSIGSDMAAVSAAFVAESLGLPTSPASAVARATNKLAAREILRAACVRQPEFVGIGDLIPESVHSLRYPLIVKPSDRSGGRGVRRVDDPSRLFRAINNAREVSFERRAIVEELVDGRAYSCECISWCGRHSVVGYTRRSSMLLDSSVYETSHVFPANLPLSVERIMPAIASLVLDSLGIDTGASSIEFFVDAERHVIVNEVSPTMSGDFIGTDLVPMTCGYDYLGAVIDIANGIAPQTVPTERDGCARVSFVYSAADIPADRADCVVYDVDTASVPTVPDGTRYGYYIEKQRYREFGGAPSLELARGKALYRSSDRVLPLNCELSAFRYALAVSGTKRLWMPHYLSPRWSRLPSELGIETVCYGIGEDLLPIGLSPEKDDTVLLVNYHAACGEYIKRYTEGHGRVIIDNSMAFFAEPIMREGVYNIYSCRKFFSVADGGYLVAERIERLPLERDVSYRRAGALLHALELGESSAYKDAQTNEQEIAGRMLRMSELTERMMASFDTDAVKRRRRENFELLEARLGGYQTLACPPRAEDYPQFFPLLPDCNIRSELVARRIFVPLMWRRMLEEHLDGTTERALAERLLLLPIDQRYSTDDMEYIADTVEMLLS